MSTTNIDWEKLEKHLNGDHSLELNEEENAMAALMQELKSKPALLGAIAHTNPKAAWELFRTDRVQEAEKEKKPVWGWKRLAVAAVSAGIVITSAILWINYKTEPEATAQRIVSPNVDKVTLVLADNRRIELDSAKGSVQQGVVSISFDKDAAVFNASEKGDGVTGYNTVLVPRGKKFQLTLEDGTKIWLNSDSRFRFPVKFSAENRDVELEGEGYFEVAHAPKKPFVVSYRDKTVRVLGTRFNINAYSSSEAVTLLQGSIQWTGLEQSIILKPGQQVQVTASSVVTRSVQAEDYILWIRNTLLLEQKSIKNLFDDIARHYDVEIRYKGEVSDSIQFNGAFEFPPTLNEMLSLINSTGKVTAAKKENYVLIEQSSR
ncbi:MAG TPA: FecR domain-containing protein [Chitinophagaceae bacterium]|nr:FecR domain-containing protein [Chitinophagaceae bacterium]